jgi:ferredoxin-NADP reductase
LLFWAGVWAMATKYILAINRKHLFNPVAIAVVITAFALNQSAIWWVGNLYLMPLVVVGGLLIIRKIEREDLVFYFLLSALVTILGFTLIKGGDIWLTLANSVAHSSLFFFAFVMLTEPLTTPPTKKLQIIYAILVGFLFAPQVHIGNFFFTPELALIIGNVFSYLVSPKDKLFLTIKEKKVISSDVMDFIFTPSHKLKFLPGQYMEWTLSHKDTDDRGNRRYFTIASSPTESTLRLGVKFSLKGSSYKYAMQHINGNKIIVGAQLAGDFILPEDPNKKVVLISGGIGVTPYRSMLKYLVDIKQSRSIVQFFSNKTPKEIIYKDVFDRAERELGIHTVYTLTDSAAVPKGWSGEVGRINEDMIKRWVPDYHESIFYISGPHNMVTGIEAVLATLGVFKNQIKKDYFPGLM